MFLHLQIDNGIVTGCLRSSYEQAPDGGVKGLPEGRIFVTIGDEHHPDYDRSDLDWMGKPYAPAPVQ